MQCATHPNVETELRCGKCDTPICPRCMVQTPVGARCRSCANLRRPVIYTATPSIALRAFGAAMLLAVVVGLAWGYLLPRAAEFLGFFVFFAAAGYGWLVARTIGWATKYRRGQVMQVIAATSCVVVYLVHNLVAPVHTLVPRNDLYGYVFVGIAAVVAIGYLR
jgi:hypothetical protein